LKSKNDFRHIWALGDEGLRMGLHIDKVTLWDIPKRKVGIIVLLTPKNVLESIGWIIMC
jgi:hypothetical protein